MAQWIVATTDVPSGKDRESDWKERGAYSKHDDALKAARKLRKTSPPRVRVRTQIDHARGGMTG
jgi:hypothetical protein